MDPWVGHQVGLELVQVNVQGAIKPERGSDGGDNLTDQPVKISVGWPVNVQVSATNIVDGFVVDHEGTVRVFQGGVSAQGGVVGLNNSSSHLNSSYAIHSILRKSRLNGKRVRQDLDNIHIWKINKVKNLSF